MSYGVKVVTNCQKQATKIMSNHISKAIKTRSKEMFSTNCNMKNMTDSTILFHGATVFAVKCQYNPITLQVQKQEPVAI